MIDILGSQFLHLCYQKVIVFLQALNIETSIHWGAAIYWKPCTPRKTNMEGQSHGGGSDDFHRFFSRDFQVPAFFVFRLFRVYRGLYYPVILGLA